MTVKALKKQLMAAIAMVVVSAISKDNFETPVYHTIA